MEKECAYGLLRLKARIAASFLDRGRQTRRRHCIPFEVCRPFQRKEGEASSKFLANMGDSVDELERYVFEVAWEVANKGEQESMASFCLAI